MYYNEDELREHYLKLDCWDIKVAAFMLTHIEDEKERLELEELMRAAIIAGTLVPVLEGNNFKQEAIIAWHNVTVNNTTANIIPMTRKNGDETFKAMKHFIGEFERNREHNRTPTFDELFDILLSSDLSLWDITITPKDKRRLKQRHTGYYK
jgi:hypothetical protein